MFLVDFNIISISFAISLFASIGQCNRQGDQGFGFSKYSISIFVNLIRICFLAMWQIFENRLKKETLFWFNSVFGRSS